LPTQPQTPFTEENDDRREISGDRGDRRDRPVHGARLAEKGHAVGALVHREDERSEALRGRGAEIVVGDLLEHDDAIRATAGTTAAYFCYPIRPGLIQATAYFADVRISVISMRPC
jgi:hypothetical protein